jgi:hypothetical protein
LIIACLIGSPTECEEFTLPLERSTGMRGCMFEAQFQLVHWQEDWPDWQIKRWSCRLPEA